MEGELHRSITMIEPPPILESCSSRWTARAKRQQIKRRISLESQPITSVTLDLEDLDYFLIIGLADIDSLDRKK